MENCDKPTKILSDEHKNIVKVIDAVIAERGRLESGKAIDTEFFEKAVDFIRNYADKFHHAKEEDILFVELQKDGVEMHCDPIPQMLHEHDEGRNFVKIMVEGINENNKDKILQGAKGYTELLREHIFKEDNILYPMGDDALSDQMQESILERFKEAEKKFMDGTKDRCLATVKEFEEKKV